MSRLSPSRAVWLAWVIILAALFARAWWVWASGQGPLPWKNEKPPEVRGQ